MAFLGLVSFFLLKGNLYPQLGSPFKVRDSL